MQKTDVRELGISKNLLQMNFMRRTLVEKEKATPKQQSDLLPNPEEYPFNLPPLVKDHLGKMAAILRFRPKVTHEKSLFEIYGVPAGFRQSYGGFNTTQNTIAPALLGSEVQSTPTTSLRKNRDLPISGNRFQPLSEPKASRKQGLRPTFRDLGEPSPDQRHKRRKTAHM
ncbi:hypothetical protein CSKR_104524 [Clonorchis sinensis]|uniref:Uncharacterized protein n=2 Tax=Clonorchis sinensis TaxID=79923 RepID=A0A8T1M609_CLOSI|nr:hypothetical protein CSKR_104524 [Clonorchis sinensis]GAA51696.1 hypothetical protein CLF_106644 [Clonorchis sinensis]